MCNNSLFFKVTTTPATILAGGILPLTTIARRRGRLITSENDSISLNAPGYYKVTVTVTASGSEAGDIVLNVLKNGIEIPGLTASETITTATTELRTLTISGTVRVLCGEGSAVLTLVNASTIGITTSNISVAVEYLD